jgi:glycosyltransferase involved in cell wall biosynthesis
MKILQVSTYDISGGAARATYRLHRGLRQVGQDCRMVVTQKETDDEFIIPVSAQESDENRTVDFFLSRVIQGRYIDAHRTEMSNTLFSLPCSGLDLSSLSLVQGADVINLHWVARFQSTFSLGRLFSLKKPVVWTLHDQWAFTGGCHYSAGCLKYRTDCVKCPQLDDDPFQLPATTLKDKAALFRDANLTIVTPSRWMAKCARESVLFRDLRIEVIPNSLEIDLYTPLSDGERMEPGPEGGMVTLLFGGEDGNEKRKGFKELMKAVQHCLKDERFQDLVKRSSLRLICFGRPNHEIAALGIPVEALGFLDSDAKIRNAYAGADIFILPSLEDNLPNTILEAMSCGTPVVAFEIGGIPEMVQSGITGELAPSGEWEKLGNALLSLIFNPEKREAMRRACRKKIETEYPLHVQAQAYLALYRDLARRNEPYSPLISAPGREGAWKAISEGSDRPEGLSVPREQGIGFHFGAIYDQVLFKALKDFAPEIHKQWEISEADRKTRYDQIIELTVQLRESESDRKARLDQIEKLTVLLRESESDRKARLAQITILNHQIAELNNQITDITQLFGESEADRRATLDQISELAGLLDRKAADWKNESDRLDQGRELPKAKRDLRHLSLSRIVEALQNGIEKMKYELERAYGRAGTAEKGWRDLESTFVVQTARKWGLIRVEPYPFAGGKKLRNKGKNRMHLIAVDMTPLLPGGENGGAKIFAIELLRSLQRHVPNFRFVLLTAAWNHEELAMLDGPTMSRLCVLTGKTNGKISPNAQYPGRLRRRLGKMTRSIRQFSQTGVTSRRLLGSLGVGLLFCPFTAPTYAEPGIPTVSVLYDLQHRDYPQFFSPHEIGVRDLFMKELRERADHIVCISEHVRQTVLTYLKTDPERTHTAHVCIQSRLSAPDQKTIENERLRLGIAHRPYMFYPANFWPHKNHRMLLTAFGIFLSRNPKSPLDLVFTGALDDFEKELKRAVERMGLRDRVHFLGFLPQAQLEVVWYACDFLIFPSLYEGFGIPVLEAMSIGKPVLCSNTTSLPEVAGEAALYFDPRKPDDMVKCIERMTGDPHLKKELAEKGLAHATNFSHEKMRDTYTAIFASALQGSFSSVGYVSGIYNDGWIGEGMTINCGPGSGNRTLEVQVSAPSWLPSVKVRLRLRDDRRVVKKVTLRRGSEVTVSRALSEHAGRFTLTVAPTFRPSECNIGEDGRILGVKCKGCWIVHADQNRAPLLKADEECISV